MADYALHILKRDPRIIKMMTDDDYWLACLLDPRCKGKLQNIMSHENLEQILATKQATLVDRLIQAFPAHSAGYIGGLATALQNAVDKPLMVEFVPSGRDHSKQHPNALNLQLRQLQPATELWSSDGAAGLVGSLRDVTIHEKSKENWQLRKGVGDPSEDVEYDEELYVAGNMVIWSKGSKIHASAVYKAFTVDSPVVQALWCDFTVIGNKSENEECEDKVEKCICILQRSCINVHNTEGKDYIAPLPFQVANIWPTKYGLLFERNGYSHEISQSPPRYVLSLPPKCFFPLDMVV
ncbi:unnamed protein product [Ranitomeya imitator]|uniref:Anaphase-promoting complex subunit 1 N-terminal domain-containing protein n=1 Tax=Ranitomeya imitator TaxID=111125 RepID=A0ABN9L2S2_9NEOB|nr:unnamed protein product [Ranitomeya imitator]